MGLTYEDAGVDIEAGEKAVERIEADVEATFTPEVLTGLGSFGAMFAPDLSDMKEPVLVSGTDGVGTKLKVAFRAGQHDTIGIDLVAMCMNDILAQGARPLFFLDYLSTGELEPQQVEEIVSGIAAGCQRADCALIGGETAEMPGFYPPGEYDLAGFGVGIAEKQEIITGENIVPGDKMIGLSSNGLHSNGYSLVRKIFFAEKGYQVTDRVPELGCTLKEELLKPTNIYTSIVLDLIAKYQIKGIAHITGGGLAGNIPRLLPAETKAVIDPQSWPRPKIFKLVKQLGAIEKEEMYRTFNLGMGLVMVVKEDIAAKVKKAADSSDINAYIIGEISQGTENFALK